MIQNCFVDEVGVRGQQKADHDAHDNDRGLHRGRITLKDHVGDGMMKDGEHSDRLAVAVVDAIDESHLWRMGCAVLPLSGPLKPVLQSQSSSS